MCPSRDAHLLPSCCRALSVPFVRWFPCSRLCVPGLGHSSSTLADTRRADTRFLVIEIFRSSYFSLYQPSLLCWLDQLHVAMPLFRCHAVNVTS
jgi:hypothetical protein